MDRMKPPKQDQHVPAVLRDEEIRALLAAVEKGSTFENRRDAAIIRVFLDTGAYGFAMASTYNARPLPAEVLVDGDTATLIRRRGTFEDLFRNETT